MIIQLDKRLKIALLTALKRGYIDTQEVEEFKELDYTASAIHQLSDEELEKRFEEHIQEWLNEKGLEVRCKGT